MWVRAIVGIVAVAWATSSFAFDYPQTTCLISSDKTSVEVHASNGGASAYQCTMWCKATVTGQQAFTPVTCSFRLGANAADKIECDQSAPNGGTFSAIVSKKSTCVPR